MKMQMDMADFFADRFVANMAFLLSISPQRIKIADVRRGSVIVDFDISPAQMVAKNVTEVAAQVQELTQLTQNFSQVIASGKLEEVNLLF